MKKLSIDDLEPLALGTAILGSGGGGDPSDGVLMARHALETYGDVTLLDPTELEPSALVVPIAMMGAPLVSIEKLPGSKELLRLIALIEETLGRSVDALMPAEIGGSNAFTPLFIAGKLDLPVVDADEIGRAFPELQMSSSNLMGISSSPAFLADSQGNSVVIHARNANSSEHIGRHVAVAMGSSCVLALYLLEGHQVAQATVNGSMSQAIALGRAVQGSQEPIQGLLDASGGKLLTQGMIHDIDQSIRDGFLEGTVRIGDVELLFQNEYLLARGGKEVLGCTPDILMLLETDSGTPITSEMLRYGLRVSLVCLPAPAIWQTEKGLELVGPQAFGFDTEYQPISRK
jgi:DUF917 family protein